MFTLFVAPTNITTHPQSIVVFINSLVTLSCEATGSDPIGYQWKRVNGEISIERATGVKTQNLTISPVKEEDENEYYCVTTNGGVDRMRYRDTSQMAQVTVFGKMVHKLLHLKPCLPVPLDMSLLYQNSTVVLYCLVGIESIVIQNASL